MLHGGQYISRGNYLSLAIPAWHGAVALVILVLRPPRKPAIEKAPCLIHARAAASHVQCALICALRSTGLLSRLLVLSFIAAIRAHAGPSQREQQLFDLVNHEREKAGLAKLEWSDRLANAALEHSRLLAEHQDLSHQFEGEPSLQQRVGATALRFNSVAENVAEAPDVETAHKGLMQSPGHRANILHQEYNAIGIAIVEHGHQLFVTQDFAHTLVSYSEKQFRDAVVTGFNQARRARGLRPVDVIFDARLRKSACAQDMNTDKLIQSLPGAASLLVFSLSEPGALPDDLRKFMADKTVERMNIGVCLQTGGKTGFSKFWVVAAFYRSAELTGDSGTIPKFSLSMIQTGPRIIRMKLLIYCAAVFFPGFLAPAGGGSLDVTGRKADL